MGIYLLLPRDIVDSVLQRIIQTFRIVFSATIKQTEENIRETFKIHVLYPIPDRSINIWHPHGLSGVTPVIHNGYKLTDVYKPTKGVVHTFFFYIPIVKDLIRYLNAIESDYTTIKQTLQKESVSVALGGAKEMKRVRNKVLDAVIKPRSGLFKIALETGTPIVPILTYGENEIFPQMQSSFLEYINDRIYSVFKIYLPFPSLKSLDNWRKISQHPLEQIHTYTGEPIYTKKIENPSKKQIEKLKSIYIARLQELFEKTHPPEYTIDIT
jgi:2-acylglycerol O-acyltransferase 2